jgi:hypothetical protein
VGGQNDYWELCWHAGDMVGIVGGAVGEKRWAATWKPLPHRRNLRGAG